MKQIDLTGSGVKPSTKVLYGYGADRICADCFSLMQVFGMHVAFSSRLDGKNYCSQVYDSNFRLLKSLIYKIKVKSVNHNPILTIIKYRILLHVSGLRGNHQVLVFLKTLRELFGYTEFSHYFSQYSYTNDYLITAT
jgi:hypothetical protein